MMDWLDIIVNLSVTLGSATIVTVASRFITAYFSLTNKEKKATQDKFEETLKSDDLATLGSFLDNVIGKFTIHEYVSNENVMKMLDSYIDRVQNYVGTAGKFTEAGNNNKESRLGESSRYLYEPLYNIDDIEEEISHGEIWNGLARLRRLIEYNLKEYATNKGVKVPVNIGAGGIVKYLHRKELIPAPFARELEEAVRICNKAVHGSVLETAEPYRALEIYRKFLSKISNMDSHRNQNAWA